MTALPGCGLIAGPTPEFVQFKSRPLFSLAWLCTAFLGLFSSSLGDLYANDPNAESPSNRRARIESAIRSIPFDSIDQVSSHAIRDVLDNPSFYRQLPQRTLDCDPQLLNFMVRHPEVMVNIWELVGITNITAKRTGNRTFSADDGAGTKCNCELIYSDNATHVYYGTGNYDGMLMPRTIKGRVVCVLRSSSQPSDASHSGYHVLSTMDVFLKVDNIGADLLTRTMGPLVGKVTDHNFEETSKFVSQFSEFCAYYPNAAQSLAGHLRVSNESIRQEFVTIATRVGKPVRRVELANQAQHADVCLDAGTRGIDIPAGSDELRGSLGQIRLATLPDLMVATDLPQLEETHEVQLPSDQLAAEAAETTSVLDGGTQNEQTTPSADDGFTSLHRTLHGKRVPRRSGLTLRR